jgi:hypothetical protein
MESEFISDYIAKVIEIVHTNNEFGTNLNTFRFTCIINDMYLKDFTYNSALVFWRHTVETTKFITVKDLRRFIMCKLHDIILSIYKNYSSEWDREKDINRKKQLEPRMQIARGMCEMLNDGSVFKELVDCYKKGYF